LSHKTAVAVGCLMQYLRFILVSRFIGLDAHQYLHGVNFLMNPSQLTEVLSTTPQTQLENGRFNERSDLLVEDNKYAVDERNDNIEMDEDERNDQQRQANYPDNNAEIELRDDDSVLAKIGESDKEELDNSYGSDDNGVMKDQAMERGVHVKYRYNNRLIALDPVLSSLTTLFVILIIITFLIIAVLSRKLHCRFYNLCRIYRRLCRL